MKYYKYSIYTAINKEKPILCSPSLCLDHYKILLISEHGTEENSIIYEIYLDTFDEPNMTHYQFSIIYGTSNEEIADKYITVLNLSALRDDLITLQDGIYNVHESLDVLFN